MKKIVIVGAGIIGSNCALALQQSGHQVTLIDEHLPGESTSYGNAGCISPSAIIPFSYPGVWREVPGWLVDPLGPLRIRWHSLPRMLPWFWRFLRAGRGAELNRIVTAQAALMKSVSDDYQQLLTSIKATGLVRHKGAIFVYDSQQDWQDQQWAFALKQRFGFAWETLDRARLKRLEPALNLQQEQQAVYLPDWQHTVNPRRLTRQIADHVLHHGGRWVSGTVRRATVEDGEVSLLLRDGSRIQGDILVVAAGVWSNTLARQLDFAVPMIAKRGYHAMLLEPTVEVNHPLQFVSRFFMATPMDNGLRLAGTAEFAAPDATPDYRRADILIEHAKRYLPDLSCRVVSRWMGRRPVLPDSLPIISRSPSHKQVYYAFGHGHYGLTQGPTSGRLIAALVNNNSVAEDLTPFRFDRFA